MADMSKIADAVDKAIGDAEQVDTFAPAEDVPYAAKPDDETPGEDEKAAPLDAARPAAVKAKETDEAEAPEAGEEAEAGEDAAASEEDADLLERARSVMPEERILRYADDPDGLRTAVEIAEEATDRLLLREVSSRAEAEPADEEESETPPGEKETTAAQVLTFDVDEDAADPQVRTGITLTRDAVNKLAETVDRLVTVVAGNEQEKTDRLTAFYDEQFNATGEHWEPILGKGTAETVARPALEARKAVFDAVAKLQHQYRAAGKPIPRPDFLIDRALRELYPVHYARRPGSEGSVEKRVERRATQTVGRPTGRKAKAETPYQKAIEAAKEFTHARDGGD